MVKISACVIVKNEEKNMGRWLDGMRQIADEMIVVDTGSDDNTAAIALAAGARVVPFVWIDDFAAAKNFAIEQAKGEWIVFPDADEYFSPDSLPLVRRCIEKYHPNRSVFGLLCRLLDFDEDDHHRLIRICYQARIFRNQKRVRYVGQVHEGICPSGVNRGRLQYVEELRIYHTGYSSGRLKDKLRRNLHILQAEAARSGEQPAQAIYFMEAYHGLGEDEQAMSYARKAIASGVVYVGLDGHAHETLISLLLKHQHPQSEIQAVLQDALQKYPALPAFPVIEGILAWADTDYVSAEQAFRRALLLRRQQPAEEANTSLNLEISLYWYLGQLAQMQRNDQQALEYFIEGLRLDPYDKNLLGSAYESMAGQPAVEIIEFLNQFYDKQSDAAFLAAVLRDKHPNAVYLYYEHRAGLQSKFALVDYLAAGRYDAASQTAADGLKSLLQLGWSYATKEQRGTLWPLLPPAFLSDYAAVLAKLSLKEQG